MKFTHDKFIILLIAVYQVSFIFSPRLILTFNFSGECLMLI